MDSSYSDLSKIVETRDNELKQVRQQLQAAQADIIKLQQENIRIRSLADAAASATLASTTASQLASATSMGSTTAASTSSLTEAVQQHNTLVENLEVIFTYLNLPNVPVPSKEDMVTFVGIVRGIIERAKRSNL
eukprot:jgi/Hompol1/5221/HPOL_000699-RA